MEVRGGDLQSIRYSLDVPSAQVKSGILLAGLVGQVPVSVREVVPTRDHTERLLRALGVDLPLRDGWLELQPPLALPAAEYRVPGDPSAAAFFVAFALAASRGSLTIQRVLLNPRRVGFLRAVERMGGVFDVHNESTVGGEVVGDLAVHASSLRGIDVPPAEVPDLIDELPVLGILAALADGETRVRGAGELRHKESDRLRSIVQNLRAVGVAAEEEGDGFVIPGGSRVGPATITTHGDHRIAMAFAVLSRVTGVPLQIDDPSCVAVSYPTFWSDLAAVDGSR
jgi:3-phosphoshikimate 1-carboxyvinyltransferase